MISKKKITRGHNSMKNVGGATDLLLCTSSDCIKLHENISKGFRITEWTQFS